MKSKLTRTVRCLPFLLGIHLLGALAAYAAAPSAADVDSAAIEMPSMSVTGRKGGSDFKGLRDRSKDILNYQVKKKTRDPNLIAEFVGEGVIPGAQVWMYPGGEGYPLPGLTDAQAHSGRVSLEMTLKADVYSGGAVCSPSPLNIAPYLKKGMLELWVKGAVGQEVFSIGLLDNGDNPVGRPLQVSVSSRSYSKVGKDEWRRIRIPLRALGTRGSYWSEELNARISSALNINSISCLSIDIDKDRHKSFKIWLDDVRLFKVAPGGESAGGTGYSLSNEGFEDFPASNAASLGGDRKKEKK